MSAITLWLWDSIANASAYHWELDDELVAKPDRITSSPSVFVRIPLLALWHIQHW